MRLASLLFCVSTAGFATTWSGYLVNSRCYGSNQANVSQDANIGSSDLARQVRTCAAKPGTKRFAVVPPDWSNLRLDPAGNAKASSVVKNQRHGKVMGVTVAGPRRHNRVKVASLRAIAVRTPR
jgi:hypothetical protein